MDDVRWEDPPPHGNSRPKASPYQTAADALRSRPGQWAIVAENLPSGTAGGLAHRIKTGRGPFAPLGSFESRCVGPANSKSCKVYARYVGKAGA